MIEIDGKVILIFDVFLEELKVNVDDYEDEE